MITGLILRALGGLMSWLAGLLPVAASQFLPTMSTVNSWVLRLGPLDRFVPVYETFKLLEIWLLIWLPVIVTYVLVTWVYAHLPVVGKG